MPRPLSFLLTITAIFTAIFSPAARAQQPTCNPNATSTTVHVEGLTERVGNITLSCSGGTAGSTASLTVFITLNAAITNRTDVNGDPVGITQTGATGSLRLTSATTLSYSPLNYTVPTPSSTPVVITISGIRAAVATAAGGSRSAVVTASILGVGASFPPGFSVIVATAGPTLLSSAVNNGIPCTGSPLPATLDLPGFAASSISSTLRITEAHPAAFSLADAGADSGLRFRVTLTGYGAGTRVFVPDAIVGNDGTVPTLNGAFGSSVTPGVYTPGASQLLLVRVTGATAGGAGGAPVIPKPTIATSLISVGELTFTGSVASAVYEVLDGNPNFPESAQIPVFAVAPATSCPSTLNPQLALTVAPVSTVATGTAADAIPRFVQTAPALDCQPNGDCNANYFPKLFVDQTAVTLTGSSKGNLQSMAVRVANTGAGLLNFTTSIAYQSASGWLSVSPASGTASGFALANLQVLADPTSLPQGTYTATITVDAGLYGTAAIPVTFNVGPVGVVVQNVGNAASFSYGTVAPGSYAVLYGLNMSGFNVGVTFNGLPATVIYKSATQINLIVPPALGTQQAANVLVTVDGLVSNSFKVNLVLNSPGIFTPGIVNFADGTVNDAAHPAARDSFVLVFFTGLTIPLSGQVTVNLGNLTNLIPAFAGAQPTLPALDQVNIVVPASLLSGTSPVPLQVCIPGSVGQQVCSNQVSLYIK